MHAETNLHPLMAQALAAFAPPQSEVHREPVTAKPCQHCGETKPLDEFYKNHLCKSDGHVNTCKACQRAYEKSRAQLQEVKARSSAAKRKYAESQHGKAAHTESNRAYRARNAEKVRAHSAVAYAVRHGKLQPLPCAVCGQSAEAHHPDYSKPLDVVWLCPAHHKAAHAAGESAAPTYERHVIHPDRFNTDDLYEFDAHTFELFRQHSPQRADLQHLMRGAPSGVAMLHDGHSLARGAKVKGLGLWVRRSVPAFIMHGATA